MLMYTALRINNTFQIVPHKYSSNLIDLTIVADLPRYISDRISHKLIRIHLLYGTGC